jgi:type IX secretion system PorP/SprF family membrane protein
MIKNLLVILLITIGAFSFGQQEAQYSNYQMNNFMLNPAVAGSYSYWSAKVGYRTQWVGMEGGPKTMFATVHGPLNTPQMKKKRRRGHKSSISHGLGGSASYDKAGAISYTGFSGTYAIHSQLNRTFTLSLGASFGIKEFRLDGSQLKFVQTLDDPELNNIVYSHVMPDMNLGFWLYSERIFFGGSARQVLQSGITIESGDEVIGGDYSKLYNHYFVTAGTKLQVNQEWTFVPSVMVQAVRPAPVQVDLNGTFWFKEQMGLGFSYRHLDAVYIVLEYVYENKFEFSYAFDFTLSELSKYNNGTHEIILGIRWGLPNRKILCPAKFW